MYTTIITPAEPVVTLERARLQCKIDGNERDDEIKDAIETARAWVQEALQRSVGPQTLEFSYPVWCGSAQLPFDITTLVSVKVDGVAVDPAPVPVGRVITLDATGKVDIRITTGYTTATLPGPVKSVMLLMIADLVRNVQGQTGAQLYENPALESLLWPYSRRVPL